MKNLTLLFVLIFSFSLFAEEDCIGNCAQKAQEESIYSSLNMAQVTRIFNQTKEALSDEQAALEDRLFEIIDNGDTKALKELLEAGLDPNTAIGGSSLLWQIPLSCSIDDCTKKEIDDVNNILETILKYSTVKVNTEVKNLTGRTPLIQAASGFNFRAMDLLLTYGANPDAVDNKGIGMIGWFQSSPDKNGTWPIIETLKVLKKHGVNINRRTGINGSFAVFIIGNESKPEFVRELHKLGLNLDKPFESYESMPIMAVTENLEVLKILVEEVGVDYNRTNYAGRTALSQLKERRKWGYPISKETLSIIRYLESIGAK